MWDDSETAEGADRVLDIELVFVFLLTVLSVYMYLCYDRGVYDCEHDLHRFGETGLPG